MTAQRSFNDTFARGHRIAAWRTTILTTQRLAILCLALLWLVALALIGGCASEKPAPTTTVNRSYAFWPPFPQEPRIVFLKSYTTNADLEPGKTKFDEILYGKEAQQESLIQHPYGVDMVDGKIYVCDTKSGVVILDLHKKQMSVMGVSGAVQVTKPVDIAIAPDGRRYVADSQRECVYVFGPNDQFQAQIGHAGLKPVSVAVHGNELYVSDFKANQVEVFDRNTGQSLRMIGGPGQEKGKFVCPVGVDVDKDGNVYVDDIINCRIQKFTPDGKKVTLSIGQLGDRPGTFTRPKHLAVDSEGTIYVVDAAFQNVQMFNQQGKGLLFFGSAGSHPGAMDMPAGICVHEGDLDLFANDIPPAFDAQRLIIVTNQFGDNRVSIYAMGHLKPGHSVNELAGSQAAVPIGTSAEPTKGPGFPLDVPQDQQHPSTLPTTGPSASAK